MDDWILELERELARDERDEWEGSIPWDKVVALPRGLILQGKASGSDKDVVEEELRLRLAATYPDATQKYRMVYADGWHVYHQCPCGHIACHSCIIPSIAEYEGNMVHDDLSLEELFLQEDPMPLAQAKAWWVQRARSCHITITNSKISVHAMRKWSDFCSFPPGRHLRGKVAMGKELETLRTAFSDTYTSGVSKFCISENSVVHQCPCGKTACDLHMFPANVTIKASFPLVLKLRKKTIHFGNKFRTLAPMTTQEVADWFRNIPLKWQVDIGDDIRLRILCKCKRATETVPCAKCTKMHKCVACQANFKRTSMTNKMCHNCHHKQIIHCSICKKKVARGHPCKPLCNTHFAQELTGIYPPIMRSKLSTKGVCMDCGEIVSYNIYHRHQYRRHHGVAPGQGYSRDYKLHTCTYCNYTSYDISNVHTHEKSHVLLRQHPCRHGCGAHFTQHAAEVLHCQRKHDGMGVHTVTTVTKRVGDILTNIPKKMKH